MWSIAFGWSIINKTGNAQVQMLSSREGLVSMHNCPNGGSRLTTSPCAVVMKELVDTSNKDQSIVLF